MSDIELKALRESLNSWGDKGDLPIAGAFLEKLLDRLESAERRAEEAEKECAEQARLLGMGAERELGLMAKLNSASEMATKHGEVLQLVGSALGMSAGSSLHTELMPLVHKMIKDAERYQWLLGTNGWDMEPIVEVFINGEAHGPGHLDAQVDASMAQEGGK